MPTLKEQVVWFLEREAAPALRMDAVELEVFDVLNGVVRLRLSGECSGCPSSVMAILMELEQELRRQVPGVEYVQVLASGALAVG